jgi:hypothetical protein
MSELWRSVCGDFSDSENEKNIYNGLPGLVEPSDLPTPTILDERIGDLSLVHIRDESRLR